MKKRKKGNNIKYSRVIVFISLLLFCLMIGRVIQLGLSKKVDGINLKEIVPGWISGLCLCGQAIFEYSSYRCHLPAVAWQRLVERMQARLAVSFTAH